MARITSNQPFKNRGNVRRGAGPVYNKFKPQKTDVQNVPIVTSKLAPCDGQFDNLVQYVFEYDLSGNHLGYVDCDYVE
jgi:hypothetical protein